MRPEAELADTFLASQVQLTKVHKSYFESRMNQPAEQILLSRQPYPRGDDRERITRARQAAEALFIPRRPVTEQLLSDAASTDPSVRRPRVLAVSQTAPVRHEELEPPVAPELQPRRAIPRSQFARIRTLAKYGMTVSQAAEVYGAAVDDIERILRKA